MQNAHFVVTLDAEQKIHEQLEASIEKEQAIMDHVEAMLHATTKTSDTKQLLEALKSIKDIAVWKKD